MVELAARESPLAASAAFLIVLGLVIAAVAVSGLRRVGPSERLVVRRFGRTRGVRGPGLRYLLPLADTGVRVPLRRVDEAVRPWGVAARLVTITDATVPVRSAPGCPS